MILYDAVFNIEPVAQERPRVRVIAMKGKKPFATVYDPKKSKDFKKALQVLIEDLDYPSDPIDEPLILSCRIFIKRPKSVKRLVPEVKPDLSNYIKGIEDAMNGIVYTDDSKIIGYEDCYKLYTTSDPRIEVTLFNVDDPKTRWVKEKYCSPS